MCGICGIYGLEDKVLIRKMMGALSHRGNDDSGIYLDKGISLGHQRLSIIDIEGGHQPMANEDGSIWTVYNGEIYNYKALKEELEKKGHRFSTSSDTEVIVHAYEEYGNAFVERLRGMFAFAIWDGTKKRLLLARDRIGIKPLYYAEMGGVLIFASEIKGILQYSGLKTRMNKDVLDEFLSFGYVSGENTLFEEIKKLEQGTLLSHDREGKNVERYWALGIAQSLEKNENSIVKELREKIEEGVEAHMIADVPVGAFLSGGIDSSYIVGLMSRLMDEPLKTFSVGFGSEEYDELKYARFAANYFGTEHEEMIVKPEPELLPKITWHLEEPLTDPALIPTYKVSELARKKVKVVLTGDGADEQFAGYNVHKIMYANRLYSKYFGRMGRDFHLKLLPNNFRFMRGIKYATLSHDPRETFYNYLNSFDKAEKEALYNIKIKTSDIKEVDEALKDANEKDIAAKIMKIDCSRLLPNYFLMKVDKMTMANSLEARVPYLDHVLIEFTSKIPSSVQLKNFKEKYLLRKAANNILPKKIVNRPKHGFDVPIKQWLDSGIIEIARQLLDREEIKKHNLFRPYTIDKILKHDTREKSKQIWTLMMFQMWYKIFIEREYTVF